MRSRSGCTPRLPNISGKSPLAAAIRYALTRMVRMRPYPDHGLLEPNTNTAERAMRSVAIGRKTYLFVSCQGRVEKSRLGMDRGDLEEAEDAHGGLVMAVGDAPKLLESAVTRSMELRLAYRAGSSAPGCLWLDVREMIGCEP